MFLEGLRKDYKNDIECLDLSNNTITPKQLEKVIIFILFKIKISLQIIFQSH